MLTRTTKPLLSGSKRPIGRRASTISPYSFWIAAASLSIKAIIERDVSVSHIGDDSVAPRGWRSITDPARFWELYELAEKLVDFEDYFRRWRFNHVTTVERIIGFKRGTGGTSGCFLPAKDAGRGVVSGALAGEDPTVKGPD